MYLTALCNIHIPSFFLQFVFSHPNLLHLYSEKHLKETKQKDGVGLIYYINISSSNDINEVIWYSYMECNRSKLNQNINWPFQKKMFTKCDNWKPF